MSEGTSGATTLSVIIVTWNVRELTLSCIERVLETSAGIPLQIIVVDNASADGTPDAVAERFPDVVLVRNAANVGFARANNQALPLVSSRYVLYLNPDVLVGDDAIRTCVRELDTAPAVGLVGCRLTYADGRIQYECARRMYRLGDLVSELLFLHMLAPVRFARHVMGEWDHSGRRDVEILSGAFMMARREVVDAVGGLPQDIFMYHEDVAFCYRAGRLGWTVRYLGDVAAVHLCGQSSQRSRARLYLLDAEAKLEFIREGQGRVAWAVARAVFALRSATRLVMAAIVPLIPGTRRLRDRYPRIFHVEKQALELAWAVWPRAVRPLMPGYKKSGQPTPEAAGPVHAGAQGAGERARG